MFLNPEYGVLGMLAMPYYFFFELASPVIETLGYILVPLGWFFGFLTIEAMGLFFTASIVFGIITSLGSLVVEDFTNSGYISAAEALKLSLFSIPENLFYRQMTVIFRLAGVLSYRKYKSAWGNMKRQKFGK